MRDDLTRRFVEELARNHLDRARKCTEDELFILSKRRVRFKSGVTLFLLILVVLFFVSKFVDKETNLAPTCSEILAADGKTAAQMSDGGIFYCSLKWLFVGISVVAIIPLALESVQLSLIVVSSLIQQSLVLPIVDDEYVGYPNGYNEDKVCRCCMCGNFTRLDAWISKFEGLYIYDCFDYLCSCGWNFIPMTMVYQIICSSNRSGIKCFSLLEASFMFIVDLTLAIFLLPVSYMVVLSSSNIESQVVGFIAVQVLLTVANEFAKALFFPRLAIGEKMRLFVDGNPYLDAPRYWPLESLFADKRLHGYGVDGKFLNSHVLRDAEKYPGFDSPQHWFTQKKAHLK